MKTFGELHKFISDFHLDRNLFGSEEEFERDFHERCKVIGPAICQERNITPTEVKTLSPETELGEKSRLLAENLKTWYSLEIARKK